MKISISGNDVSLADVRICPLTGKPLRAPKEGKGDDPIGAKEIGFDRLKAALRAGILYSVFQQSSGNNDSVFIDPSAI